MTIDGEKATEMETLMIVAGATACYPRSAG
jgi:hypothetical protein